MILKSIRISRIRLEEGLILFAWIFLAVTGGGRSLYSFLPASMLALISCWFLLRDGQIKYSSINSPLFCFIGWLLFSILMSQNKFVSALAGLKLFSAIIVFQVFLTHREGKLEEMFWVFVSVFSLVNAINIFWKDVAWGILPPNANYCAILMAAGSVWLFSKARQEGSWKGSILCLCGVFLFFAVLRTSSRTGLLFFTFAFLTAVVKDGSLLRKKWLLFTIPVVIVLILSPRYVRNVILKNKPD